ncbi:MAG: hypothetical protein LBP62_05150 [Clostridiales bacterium]|jgi:hypothetical protein|nr:hypothetical protein [Clostridiales bacterium]
MENGTLLELREQARCRAELDGLIKEKKTLDDKISKTQAKPHVVKLGVIFYIWEGGFAKFLLAVGAVGIVAGILSLKNGSVPFGIGAILVGILGLVISVARAKKEAEKENAEERSKLEKYEIEKNKISEWTVQRDKLSDRIKESEERFDKLISICGMPREYADAESLRRLIGYFEKNRVGSLRDGINLLVEEQKADEILSKQEEEKDEYLWRNNHAAWMEKHGITYTSEKNWKGEYTGVIRYYQNGKSIPDPFLGKSPKQLKDEWEKELKELEQLEKEEMERLKKEGY